MPDANELVWRYMDFTKFVSLLDTKSLFFCRADLLGDRFEGSMASLNQPPKPAVGYEAIAAAREAMRLHVYVNCWHLNEHESAAMWRLYAQTNEAICIQSTYGRLRNVLPSGIQLAPVEYIDYDATLISESDALGPFMCKRKSFEHEREVRAVTTFPNPLPADLGTPGPLGIAMPIDVKTLISSVRVAPTCANWFLELVSSIVRKFDVAAPIKRSDIDKDPIY